MMHHSILNWKQHNGFERSKTNHTSVSIKLTLLSSPLKNTLIRLSELAPFLNKEGDPLFTTTSIFFFPSNLLSNHSKIKLNSANHKSFIELPNRRV